MPHTVNRTAFLSAKKSGQPLLSAYGQLVATELALKDHACWKNGHDVPKMLDELSDPGLNSLSLQLRALLAAIPCTDISGNAATVRPNIYPDLRYARHASDHAGGTTDVHLQNLIVTVEDIIVQLRAKGVAI